MEKLVGKVNAIMEQFMKEELGNRLSQFAMIALKEMIINEINSFKPEENKKEYKDNVVNIKGNKVKE